MAPPRGLGQLIAILLLALAPHLVAADCECGFVTHTSAAQKQARDSSGTSQLFFTNMLESKFFELKNISLDGTWRRQQYNVSARAGRGEYGKAFAVKNVYSLPGSGDGDSTASTGSSSHPADDGVALVVGSTLTNDAVPVAELDSARSDMVFGSYRAGMKLTPVNGTCAAFFWYFNDTQEIDMEFLSREFDPKKKVYPVNLVIQSEASLQAGFDASKTGTFKVVNLTFDPTAGFHEYRFDYLQDRVLFYADSQLLAEMSGSSVPTSPGHLILQHWSNGNPLWSGGPPEEDAIMTVSYVKAYFNSSDSDVQSSWNSSCQKALSKGSNETVCVVPDVTAANASTGGTFFNTSNPNDDKNGANRLGSTWAATTSALLLLLVLNCL
ncbi:glycoside hydrolase family 16 protein [Trichoderma asperellum CBS 433.97]|uniref:Endo-1,3-1,4-b-glucanase n=2 Tax=Trichoderma asperellum TaxID=101201 RepID=A0A060AFM8_TRIAP|nr:glycoside hydrolase family 16 protein [Trichoderma asperellum CBS 433.97]AIA62363.1 endo-1,3-1,4-b-glucanase [Trichoderma asperellum]AIA62364.1 endo-1,3-1,4-b-glucanase [Trichoderma asperellum]PTB35389.1 glycoside hydrolase family 16 protein [Trichoderma asperellum CBS 433.97]